MYIINRLKANFNNFIKINKQGYIKLILTIYVLLIGVLGLIDIISYKSFDLFFITFFVICCLVKMYWKHK